MLADIPTDITASHPALSVWSHLRWNTHFPYKSREIPIPLKSWLFDKGSLTQRLVTLSQGEFSVHPLSEGWLKPFAHERKALGLQTHESAFVRMVALYGNGQPWVLARSIIPRQTLQGTLRILCHLGNQPLGAFLFAHPNLQRSALEVAKPSIFSPYHQMESPGLWARRSIFSLQQRSLLVSELFLPQLFEVQSAKSGA